VNVWIDNKIIIILISKETRVLLLCCCPPHYWISWKVAKWSLWLRFNLRIPL